MKKKTVVDGKVFTLRGKGNGQKNIAATKKEHRCAQPPMLTVQTTRRKALKGDQLY